MSQLSKYFTNRIQVSHGTLALDLLGYFFRPIYTHLISVGAKIEPLTRAVPVLMTNSN